LEDAEKLRKAFQQYRMEMLSKLTAPPVPSGKPWYSRNRDLYQTLALPVSLDSELLTLLASAFEEQELLTREALSPDSWPFFRCLRSPFISSPRPQLLIPLKSSLNQQILCWLHWASDFKCTSARWGAVLLSLGVSNRKRTNTGWVLLFDQKLREYIHELAAAHRVNLESFQEKRGEKCELCDRLASERTAEIVAPNGNSAAAMPLPRDPEHRVQ
jgi:hypothetical protein